MAVSESQKRAVNKYLEGFDEFKVRLPKGYKKTVKDHTKKTEESMNAFIKRSIDETMENDKSNMKGICHDWEQGTSGLYKKNKRQQNF